MPTNKKIAGWLREASTLAKIWRNECDLRGLPMQSNGIDKDVQLFEKRAAQVEQSTTGQCKSCYYRFKGNWCSRFNQHILGLGEGCLRWKKKD